MTTVRDAAFGVLRERGLTRIYANPGSTEVDLLVDLPSDFEFVLALHEGSVVGMATGDAIASGRPVLALLHTTAGLGNAVGAIATARVNRAPVVILVGQQDRRHLLSEPFLAGHLRDLAGEYPVSVHEPARAADVPGLIARAAHDATLHRGPSIVIIPMNDWNEPADDSIALPAPSAIVSSRGADAASVAALTALIDRSSNPVLVVGSTTDDEQSWDAVSALASALDCPVWAEPHAARAGFDQSSAQFAGHLPAARGALRTALDGHDLVLIAGGPAFRQYLYAPGSFVNAGTAVAVITDDPREATMSAADLVVLGSIAEVARGVADAIAPRPKREWPEPAATSVPEVPASGALAPAHVFAALAERLPAESTLIEECPSTRGLLISMVPARRPLGFVTPAMGGLGFALPAATGMRKALPNRPIVAVVGDGSSLYNVQALWSAQHYGIGALFIVMSNGGYAVMNRLAQLAGGAAPWPDFEDVSVSTIAAGFGCPAERITTHDELIAVLDRVMPTLADRTEPLLLDIAVTAN